MLHTAVTKLRAEGYKLQRQLDQFRSTQPQRTKLPEPLWQAAVELARQHGIYPFAHPLRLDYMGLKRRLGGIPALRRKAGRPTFVELTAPPVVPFATTRYRRRWSICQ
jgi:hypothetical protein